MSVPQYQDLIASLEKLSSNRQLSGLISALKKDQANDVKLTVNKLASIITTICFLVPNVMTDKNNKAFKELARTIKPTHFHLPKSVHHALFVSAEHQSTPKLKK